MDDAKTLESNRLAARLAASEVLLGVIASLAEKLPMEEDTETLIKAIPQLHRVTEPPKDESKSNLPMLSITINGGAIGAQPVKMELPVVEEVEAAPPAPAALPEPAPDATDFLKMIERLGDEC